MHYIHRIELFASSNTILILYKELSSAIDLAYVFLKYVIANYKILEEIISDRDKLFISKF
jgi:hypothetical protein